jgi:hypothetical protein
VDGGRRSPTDGGCCAGGLGGGGGSSAMRRGAAHAPYRRIGLKMPHHHHDGGAPTEPRGTTCPPAGGVIALCPWECAGAAAKGAPALSAHRRRRAARGGGAGGTPPPVWRRDSQVRVRAYGRRAHSESRGQPPPSPRGPESARPGGGCGPAPPRRPGSPRVSDSESLDSTRLRQPPCCASSTLSPGRTSRSLCATWAVAGRNLKPGGSPSHPLRRHQAPAHAAAQVATAAQTDPSSFPTGGSRASASDSIAAPAAPPPPQRQRQAPEEGDRGGAEGVPRRGASASARPAPLGARTAGGRVVICRGRWGCLSPEVKWD